MKPTTLVFSFVGALALFTFTGLADCNRPPGGPALSTGAGPSADPATVVATVSGVPITLGELRQQVARRRGVRLHFGHPRLH